MKRHAPNARRALAAFALAALLTGCASQTELIDPAASRETTVAFDARDIAAANTELIASFFGSPRLAAELPTPCRVAWGRLVNDSCCHLDSGALVGALTEAIAESDRFTLLSGPRTSAAASAPDLLLAGKLTQSNLRRDNGGTRIEYLLTLRAVRPGDGVSLWQRTITVVKAVAPGMPVW